MTSSPVSRPSSAAPARAYLDHAATAPLRPEVVGQVTRDLVDGLASGGRPRANPAAQHASGRRDGAALAEARARLAEALGVDPHEVLLTSGGTEADALAVTGRVLAARAAGVERPGVVISPLEHPAVRDTARVCEALHGARVTELDVDAAGRVDLTSVEHAVGAGGVAVVSVMTANNETGLVQDVAGVVEAGRRATGVTRPGEPGYVPVHSDAVAAVGRVPVDVHGWGLDALTLTGHKLGAPIGVGALIARRDLALVSPTGGGRQERGLRSGTADVVGARALALAVELAVAEREAEAERLEALRAEVLAGTTALEGVHATLPEDAPHLPGTAHLWFEDGDTEALLMGLDMAGVDVSAGSACHAGVTQPSHVLIAMGFDDESARSTLRVTMGPTTTGADVERLLAALPRALEMARRTQAAKRR